jgi:hypothetical protein
MRSPVAQRYIDNNPDTETAICRFVADLMRGDPKTFKKGYSRENAILATVDAFGLDIRDIVDATINMTDNILKAENEMGFPANTHINLLNEPMVDNDERPSYQRHVAIEWEGGVLWLNMFDFAGMREEDGSGGHYCIDVRQFNSDGKLKGEGVFTMARSHQRGSIPDEDGGNVQGHGWNGGYVVCIMTDPDGEETHTEPEQDEPEH